jgi:hypothetical protein
MNRFCVLSIGTLAFVSACSEWPPELARGSADPAADAPAPPIRKTAGELLVRVDYPYGSAYFFPLDGMETRVSVDQLRGWDE